MDSEEVQEEVAGGLPPIYFCNVSVTYKKGKKKLSTHNKKVDLVSRYNTPASMQKDKITMDRIADDVYGAAYKGQKHMMIRSVNSYRVIGYVNSSAI